MRGKISLINYTIFAFCLSTVSSGGSRNFKRVVAKLQFENLCKPLWGPKEHTCSSRKCWIPTNKTYMCTYFNTTNITSSTIFRCFLLYFLLYFPEVCTENLLMEFFVCKEPDLICSLGLPMNRILYFLPNVKCSYFNFQETHKNIFHVPLALSFISRRRNSSECF